MSGTVHWFDARPAPLVLVVGPENYLASKAIRLIREALRGEFAELEVSEIPDGVTPRGACSTMPRRPCLQSHDL